MCFHIRKRKRHREIHLTFQTLIDVVSRGQNGFYLLGNLNYCIAKLGTHMLFERFKCLWLPHHAAALFNQLINAAGNAVINQIEHFAIRVKVQTEFRFVRQIGVQIFDR
ncbi:Uncharacterised protein [Vibrio cholerae]|nr:Uncharacterised protein [Vibrio cholerae]